MAEKVNEVAKAMKAYHGGDPEKITHFVRVYTLAKSIGELEKLPEKMQETLELAALTQGVTGDRREADVREILSRCRVDDDIVMNVCHIIENEKNYEHISGLDHQILIEAEHIVRFKEENIPKKEIIRISEDVFFTNYGRAFLKRAFNI